jgi:hypothetical protein
MNKVPVTSGLPHLDTEKTVEYQEESRIFKNGTYGR